MKKKGNMVTAILRAHPELALFLCLALGFLIGRIKIGTFKIGVVLGTLFAGVLIGQLDIEIPDIVKTIFFDFFLFSTGYKVGSHRIQGISDEFIPSIVNLQGLDSIIQANDGDAIIVAQKLASQLGLAVGISSGANVIGAIKLKAQMGAKAVVVTLLSDSNKKYLSTDLVNQEPMKEGYIAAALDFTNYSPMARLADHSQQLLEEN